MCSLGVGPHFGGVRIRVLPGEAKKAAGISFQIVPDSQMRGVSYEDKLQASDAADELTHLLAPAQTAREISFRNNFLLKTLLFRLVRQALPKHPHGERAFPTRMERSLMKLIHSQSPLIQHSGDEITLSYSS